MYDHLEGVSERQCYTVKRRLYHVDYPNQVWHIDSNHKHTKWKLVIHGAINGYSRTVVMLRCSANNKAATVFQCCL